MLNEYRMKLLLLLITLNSWICFTNSKICTENRLHNAAKYKELLLTRRTRAVIFPKSGNLLLTPAFTKLILGGRPSGLQYSIEFDIYHPLPDTIEAWRPTILLDKTKQVPAAAAPTKKTTTVKTTTTTAIPLVDPAMPLSLDDNRRIDSYYFPMNWNTYAAERQSMPQEHFIRQDATKFQKDFFSRSRRPLNYAPQNTSNAFYNVPNRWHNVQHTKDYYAATGNEDVYATWDDVPQWKLNRAYRERRALYDQFDLIGKMFKFDMNACIKRAMCEFSALLNLRKNGDGLLLMEDLMRLILTIPEDINDERYKPNHGKSSTARDCATIYMVSCPYKVLDFLTQSMNSNLKL